MYKFPFIIIDLEFSRLYISMSFAYFVSNFVAMATRIGRGSICVTSFNSPTPKTHVRRKNLLDISYTSRIIADFFLKFRCHGNLGRSF